MKTKKGEGSDEKTLTNLSLRIDSLKSQAKGGGEQKPTGGGLEGMGLGGRVMVELVVAPCVGVGLGYSVDIFLGTEPFGMIGGFVLGGIAGILNVKRLSDREDERLARVQKEGEEAGVIGKGREDEGRKEGRWQDR